MHAQALHLLFWHEIAKKKQSDRKNANTVAARFYFQLTLDPGVRSERDYRKARRPIRCTFYEANELQQQMLRRQWTVVIW